MVSIAEAFVPSLENCNEILNAGAINLVAPVVCGSDEPTVANITVDTALVGGEESITLTSDITEGTILRKGSIVHFVSGESITVTADTTVTTGTAVPIEAAANPIAGTDTATVWGLLMIKSPTDLPTNIESQEVNRTDLTFGIQGGMVKTKIELNIQTTAIGRKDDKALYDYVFGASYSDSDIFCLIVRSSGVTTFGRSKVVGWTSPGAIEEITRPQWTYKYQPPFAIAKPQAYLTATELTNLNSMRKLAGLSVLV